MLEHVAYAHYEAFAVHGRQVFSLHFAHSKMNQCGPEWHMLQFHSINVVSDLIILNACSHLPGFAICDSFSSVGCNRLHICIPKTDLAGCLLRLAVEKTVRDCPG